MRTDRRMRLALTVLIGFLSACQVAGPVGVQPHPSRLDDWPSVSDDEKPGPFLPSPVGESAPPWGTCLPVMRGALYYSNAALRIAAYESPSGGYFIERHGTDPITTTEALQEIKDRHANQFSALPQGTYVKPTGVCAVFSEGPTPSCFYVAVQIRRTTLAMITDQLGELLKDEGSRCIGTLLETRGWEGPRCEASAPTCQPLPHCSWTTGICEGAMPYRPDVPRKIVLGEAELTSGSCQYDGECVVNEGAKCTSYTSDGRPGDWGYYPAILSAFCGCVAEKCWWFTQ